MQQLVHEGQGPAVDQAIASGQPIVPKPEEEEEEEPEMSIGAAAVAYVVFFPAANTGLTRVNIACCSSLSSHRSALTTVSHTYQISHAS